MKNKNILLYLFAGTISLILGLYYTPSAAKDYKAEFLETSVLDLYKNVYDSMESQVSYNTGTIDLELSKVSYKKISDNSYTASLKIKNTGNHIKDLKVLASNSSDNDIVYIKNSDNGLSLSTNEEFIFRDFRFDLEPNISGGNFDFSIKIQDENILESDLNNNTQSIQITKYESLIKDVYLKAIDENGAFILDYKADKFSLSDKDFEIFFARDLDQDGGEYFEFSDKDNLYSYKKIGLNENVLKSTKWLSITNESSLNEAVKVFDDPFETDEEYFIYIKEIDKQDKTFRFSDILHFYPQDYLSRAEFAKVFVEKIEIEANELDSFIHYIDISDDSQFIPYISVLYNLGLFETESDVFKPKLDMTREEAVKIVMNYFDVDLYVNKKFDNRFEDIDEENDFYHYMQALSALQKDRGLSDQFFPEKSASKEFVNYLVDEFEKSY